MGKIPSDKIWLKIGGDHGGDSFKVVLQVANLESPNSRENMFMICMVECKDSIKNLKKVLKPVKEQIDKLTNMTWNRKTIKLFLFGDYDFIKLFLFGDYDFIKLFLFGDYDFIKLFLFGDYDFIKLFLFGDYNFY